jgi:hypothetical protein
MTSKYAGRFDMLASKPSTCRALQFAAALHAPDAWRCAFTSARVVGSCRIFSTMYPMSSFSGACFSRSNGLTRNPRAIFRSIRIWIAERPISIAKWSMQHTLRFSRIFARKVRVRVGRKSVSMVATWRRCELRLRYYEQPDPHSVQFDHAGDCRVVERCHGQPR